MYFSGPQLMIQLLIVKYNSLIIINYPVIAVTVMCVKIQAE